jgi:hypothetical protein
VLWATMLACVMGNHACLCYGQPCLPVLWATMLACVMGNLGIRLSQEDIQVIKIVIFIFSIKQCLDYDR